MKTGQSRTRKQVSSHIQVLSRKKPGEKFKGINTTNKPYTPTSEPNTVPVDTFDHGMQDTSNKTLVHKLESQNFQTALEEDVPYPWSPNGICTEQRGDGSILFLPQSHTKTEKEANNAEPSYFPAPLFCEFAAFIEHLEAPTGIIQSQTLMRVSSEIFKNHQNMSLPTYNSNALRTYLPNITKIFPHIAATAFIISIHVSGFVFVFSVLLIFYQANRIKVPTKGFYGTYTRYTWNRNRSMRNVVRVFCDGKQISEKISFEQPIAENGLFVFIQRSEVCSSVSNILNELSHEGFNRKLVFLVNLTDAIEQTNLLSLLFLVDNTCEPFVSLFPSEEVRSLTTLELQLGMPSPGFPGSPEQQQYMDQSTFMNELTEVGAQSQPQPQYEYPKQFQGF
mmetsp:Transcript_21245/g.26964  ORF Transcript_21245/g.26964 Transcript_21245/m.26964 type:complete len:393 (-) Transcript_21245:76-1254(-)